VKQLRRLIAAMRGDDSWLAALTPPPIIHFLGHIIASPNAAGRLPAYQESRVKLGIEAKLGDTEIGAAYGSLAAGADILFAEALAQRNVGLHIMLPFAVEDFIEVSVRPAGEQWVQRFNVLLERVRAQGTLRFATDDRYLDDDRLFAYCTQLSMG